MAKFGSQQLMDLGVPTPLSALPTTSFSFQAGSLYVAHAGLKLPVILPQAPKCADYKCVPVEALKIPYSTLRGFMSAFYRSNNCLYNK